jgi:RimJ/RimL family protein N-acetyltransferase
VQSRHGAGFSEFYDPSYFTYFAYLYPKSGSSEDIAQFIEGFHTRPNTLPFAIVLQETGQAIGFTSYLDIRTRDRGLEIGFSWIAKPYQGTKVNPECKLLLLSHAFEELACERVQLKCDGRNLQSQANILKLGAKHEGILRKHVVAADGYLRDTYMYSIIREEWPSVKAGLEARLS